MVSVVVSITNGPKRKHDLVSIPSPQEAVNSEGPRPKTKNGSVSTVSPGGIDGTIPSWWAPYKHKPVASKVHGNSSEGSGPLFVHSRWILIFIEKYAVCLFR